MHAGRIMRVLTLAAAIAVVGGFSCSRCFADFDTGVLSGSSGSLSASVDFKLVGTTLTVTLSNTATGTIPDANSELLGLFFNAPNLTKGKATPTTMYNANGTVFNGA